MIQPENISDFENDKEGAPRRLTGDQPWLEYVFLVVILGLLWLAAVLILVAWRNGAPS